MKKNIGQNNATNTTIMPAIPLQAAWVFCLLVALIIIAYLPTVIGLHQRWVKFDQAYSHGYGVIGLVVYFLWHRRAEVFSQGVTPQFLLLFPLLASVLLAIVAQLSYTMLIAQLLLPAILLFGFSSVCGITKGKRLFPYIALLYYAIPVWGELTPYLQELTVTISGTLLSIINIPANIQENYIQISNGTFHVASGCSGLNYFLVSLLMAAILALEFRFSFKQTLQLLCLAALLGMASNWTRVTSLIILGHFTDISHPIIHDHVLHGWLISAGFMSLLFLFASRYFTHPDTDKNTTSTGVTHQNKRYSLAAITTVVIITSIPLYLENIARTLPPSLTPVLAKYAISSDIDAPQHYKGWKITPVDKNSWHPELQNADFSINHHWFNGYESITIFVTGYLEQTQGKELINSENHVFNSHWQWKARQQGETYNDAIVQSNTNKNYVIRYWFQLGQKITASTIDTKLFSALANLTGTSNGAFIMIQSQCETNCQNTTLLLDDELDLIRKYIDYNVLGINSELESE